MQLERRQISPISGAGEPPARASNSSSDEDGDGWNRRNGSVHKRRRKVLIVEEDDDGDDVDGNEMEVECDEGECRNGEEEEEEMRVAKPIGDVVRVSGSGVRTVKHYEAFEYDGNRYQVEDPVLVNPSDGTLNPYVTIIKDITHHISNGWVMITGQCLYRPKEVEKEAGSWTQCDLRERFYSFHQKEFAAITVMHTCTVNFVPLHKQLPDRRRYPGFIVQKVYDTERKKLFNLTDKDYGDTKWTEIDLLVNKTMERLGDLPDLNIEDPLVDAEKEGLTKGKTLLREINLSPMDKSKKDGGVSKHHTILIKFRALTKDSRRDTWLERLLQSVEYVCTSSDPMQEVKETAGYSGPNHLSGKNQLIWPDSAVRAVTALEKASNNTISTDFAKYNQKMRQLVSNLKSSALLAQRLLKQELTPSVILAMTPIELKEGLTTEEIERNKPEETTRVQMTDARCKRCSERKVSLANIIKAGSTERYELVCLDCGCSWYISREKAIASMRIYEPSFIRNTGPASSVKNTEKKRRSLG